MAFITRLSRLMRADLHALLDRLEEPDLVLAQAIREMEQALDQEQRHLARLEREIQRLRERATQFAPILEESARALDDCLAAGREDLARPVIRRRLETERQHEALAYRLRETETERARRAAILAERASRLADLRARAALQEAEPDLESSLLDPALGGSHPAIRDSDVEVALLRAKRQREGLS